MRKRELTMLANSYDARKHGPGGGLLLSEKLDGIRAMWLPWTRGEGIGDVVWANRERDSRGHVCTGLWSRLAKPIFAPSWWLDLLPTGYMLDGELWTARQSFSKITSVVKKLVPLDTEWATVTYQVFDIPTPAAFFMNGQVRGPNYTFKFEDLSIATGVFDQLTHYDDTLDRLGRLRNAVVQPVRQHLVGADLQELFDTLVGAGAEGVMLRTPNRWWEPRRSDTLLKLKPESRGVGQVVGFTDGKGKYEGMIGALCVVASIDDAPAVSFEMAGMTDLERVPGYFRVGDLVNFKYNDLTADGIPRFAQYKGKVA